jgi:hypothetical protein
LNHLGLLLLTLLFSYSSFSQDSTSTDLRIADTVVVKKAPVRRPPPPPPPAKVDQPQEVRPTFDSSHTFIRNHPYFKISNKPVSLHIDARKPEGREAYFYFVIGLLTYYALVRLIFYKYLQTLFTLFFRATLRQQQLREQLLQDPLPALLLNFLFTITAGTFIAFIARSHDLVPGLSFWWYVLYGTALVAGIYLGKFVLLKLAGWIFGIRQAVDTYLFIIFLINKMIGIFLIPVVFVMAFAGETLFDIALVVAYVVLTCLLVYRFLSSYRPIRSEIKVTRFHFFLYLCAFEIAPLLLIYKVLLAFVHRTY